MAELNMDPQSVAVIDFIDAYFAAEGAAQNIDEQRRAFKNVQSQISDADGHEFDGDIADSVVSRGELTVPVRRYRPRNVPPGRGLVYFHGGGWIVGDLDTSDNFARSVAQTLEITVVSVDYRLAPEHPFPAPLEDCIAVAAEARQEFDEWCGLAGDSAGGNLALAVALASSPNEFDAQLLLYPCLDSSMTEQSYEKFGQGFGLTRETMQFCWSAYGAEHAATDPLLSPSRAENLEGLPPTVLVSAGCDVLFDESRVFAKRLVDAGVQLSYLPFMSLPHGFIETVDRVDAAKEGVAQLLNLVKPLLPARTLHAPS